MIRSILFFGTPCDFADRVLQRLATSGYSIAARVIPGRRSEAGPIREVAPSKPPGNGSRLIVVGSRDAGSANQISADWPTFEVDDHSSVESVRTLTSLGADLAVVCCYPVRIPPALIDSATRGGLNVHPSLLPRYRGPDPLFWIYRNGETVTGVTVHRVDRRLDAGEIIRQRGFELPLGTPGDETWKRSMDIGSELLLESIAALSEGKASPTPQDEAEASYQSWPSPRDLVIRAREWEAWRLFHFCRGVIPLGHMPRLTDGRNMHRVIEATGYADETGSLGVAGAGTETVTCRSGEVYLRLGPAVF